MRKLDCYKYEENRSRVNILIEEVKQHTFRSLHNDPMQLAKEAKRLMISYICNTLKEPDVAEYLTTYKWDTKMFTLVEVNAECVSGGGFSSLNNSLERCNGKQKDAFDHEQYHVTQALPKLAQFISHQSQTDLSFNSQMPKGYYKVDNDFKPPRIVDKEVWTHRFFAKCKHEQTSPFSVLDLQFSMTPHRIMVAPSLRDHLCSMRNPADGKLAYPDVAALRKALSQPGQYSDGTPARAWLNIFRHLCNSPAQCIERENMSVTVLLKWCKELRLLTPLTDEVYVRALMHRLEASGAVLDRDKVSTDLQPNTTCGAFSGASFTNPHIHMHAQILKFEEGGLFHSCSCGLYQQYAWCLEVQLLAEESKLIIRNPLTLDPEKIVSSKAGRPPLPGLALDKPQPSTSQPPAPKASSGKKNPALIRGAAPPAKRAKRGSQKKPSSSAAPPPA